MGREKRLEAQYGISIRRIFKALSFNYFIAYKTNLLVTYYLVNLMRDNLNRLIGIQSMVWKDTKLIQGVGYET